MKPWEAIRAALIGVLLLAIIFFLVVRLVQYHSAKPAPPPKDPLHAQCWECKEWDHKGNMKEFNQGRMIFGPAYPNATVIYLHPDCHPYKPCPQCGKGWVKKEAKANHVPACYVKGEHDLSKCAWRGLNPDTTWKYIDRGSRFQNLPSPILKRKRKKK